MWSAAQRQQMIYGFVVHAGFEETIDQLAMANSVRWYVLRREDGHVLRRALDFDIVGQRKKGRTKRTWRKQVVEESIKFGLRRMDVLCRSKRIVGVNKIVAGLRRIYHPHLLRKLPDFR